MSKSSENFGTGGKGEIEGKKDIISNFQSIFDEERKFCHRG